MRYISRRTLDLAGFVIAALLLMASTAAAQPRGQYILGTTGLNSGVQPQPGLSYTNIFIFSAGGTLVGGDGKDVAGFKSPDLAVDQNIFTYTTKYKLFGGNYGVKLDVPFADGPIAATRPRAQSIPLSLSDIYVEPFNLGWHLPTADLRVAYGFFAPTGADRVTSDYWGHDITAAATVYLDEKKSTSLSLNAILELHQKMRHKNLSVGHSLNVEYGIGHVAPVRKESTTFVQVGLVGYLQWQLTRDSGPNVPARMDNPRDQVFAIGPEVGLTLSKWKTHLLFRYNKEVYVRNRGQGQAFAISFSKSF
jgi:hypothetical protein